MQTNRTAGPLAAVILLTIALIPSTASAYAPAALAKAERIARTAWPESPCNGREQVTVVPASALSQGDTEYGEATIGDTETCAVRVRDDLSGVDLCTILAHEFGHLSGYAGNDPNDPGHDTAGFMAAYPTTYPPCTALEPTPRQYAARMVGVAERSCRLVRTAWRGKTRQTRGYRCRSHYAVVTIVKGEVVDARLIR